MTRRFSPSTSLGNVLISSTRELYALHAGCARGLCDFYCWYCCRTDARMPTGRGVLHHPRRLYAIRILWCQRRTLRRPPIDRLEKHRQLRRAQTHRSALGPGPNESSAAPQSLIKQTKAVLAIPENLGFIASTPTEDKNLTRVRVLTQGGLYQSAQPFKSLTHICYAVNQPDPHATGRAQHDRSNSRIMTRSARASIAPQTFTCPVPQTWISRHSPTGAPPAAGCSTAGSGAADGSTRIGKSVTGSKLH